MTRGRRGGRARLCVEAVALVARASAGALVVAALAGATSASPAHADVLVVGDSLGVGTEGALRAALPGTAIDADSRNGRPSGEGLAILADRLRPSHRTVVFDLGTNDGNAAVAVTARNLAAARGLAGGRCLVIATLNRPPQGGVAIDGQNAMIRRFAASTPNVALVDWNDVAAATPDVLRDDGVHATAGGYALRGLLFAEAIQGCLPVGAGGAGGTPGGRRPTGPAASTTDAPAAQRRSPRPRPRPRPRPTLAERVDAALGGLLVHEAGPFALAARAGALVAAGTRVLGAVATPRGPEPVLGASPDG